MSKFTDVLEMADQKNWCVSFGCTTCCNMEFRTALAERFTFFSLYEGLINTRPYELTQFRQWVPGLQIGAYDFRLTNWDEILKAWLGEGCSVYFLDQILFYLLPLLPCKPETRQKWMDASIAEAISSRNGSLLESLVRILGPAAADHPDLVTVAREVAPTYDLLSQALMQYGYIPRPPRPETAKARRFRLHSLRHPRNTGRGLAI